MPKIIVLSGHGMWMLGKEDFVTLPASTSIKFYTMNMRLLSDGFGGDLDRGIITNVEPDQEAGPFSSVPNMRLFPPTGLHIRAPANMANWHVVKLPQRVPADHRNLQIQVDPAYPGGADLKTILAFLDPALRPSTDSLLIWAACREVKLKDVGGKAVGINTLQR
ncbi:MAG: hypothetical protein R6T96_02915 [Longimicrobiales bacterium]